MPTTAVPLPIAVAGQNPVHQITAGERQHPRATPSRQRPLLAVARNAAHVPNSFSLTVFPSLFHFDVYNGRRRVSFGFSLVINTAFCISNPRLSVLSASQVPCRKDKYTVVDTRAKNSDVCRAADKRYSHRRALFFTRKHRCTNKKSKTVRAQGEHEVEEAEKQDSNGILSHY